MFTNNKMDIHLRILLLAFVVTTVNSQCTTNGCSICNATHLVCEGLDAVPPFTNEENMLESISLTNGVISEIPLGYFKGSEVTSIDLSNNQLTTLNIESFEFSTSLNTITLTENPIQCDSNIDWLQKWKSFNIANNVVIGTCSDGRTIEDYLSEKPSDIVQVMVADHTLVFDRGCSVITVPFAVIGDFDRDLVYRIEIFLTSRKAYLNVPSEVTVPVDTNTSEITIGIVNRGEVRADIETTLMISPKYPLSYERNVNLHIINGAEGCRAPVPVIAAKTPTTLPTPTVSRSYSTMEPRTSSSPGGPSACPFGYIQVETTGMCYKRLETLLSFDDARVACQEEGADLASASTPTRNTIVSDLAGGQRCWVGAIAEGETYEWLNGDEWEYTNWRKREPNYHLAGRACIETNFVAPFLWNDHFCDSKRIAVCEKAIATV